MASTSLRKLEASSYHVAWICAVADLELIPALLMLDESHERPYIDTQYDDNTYKFGTMAGHNVVVATCPDSMTGQVNVGHIVGPLFKTFTSIRMTLLVGIGGGVPQKHFFAQPLKDVRLGDVVVGWPSHADGKPAVVYYDSGRSLVGGFQTTSQLNRPHTILLKALPFLRTDHTLGKSSFQTYLDRLQSHEELGDQYKHPGLEHDLLFNSTYQHCGLYNSYCVGCDKTNLVDRKPRTEKQKDKFVFHQGRIATGNSVIQDGIKRDAIGDQHGDVFCIEMEAAGVDINSSCLIIRGISDYADSHKSDKWRPYAAGKAVVFARELLGKIPARDVSEKMASVNKHWLVDRPTNPNFVGRRAIIDKIIKGLTSDKATNKQQRFVLTGMGGQGKSEICLRVADEVRDRFWGIFWVDVSKTRRRGARKNVTEKKLADEENANESVAEVAEALGCPQTVADVKKTLSRLETAKRWLLILDNADDPDQDYQIYIPSGNRGSIILTSRNAGCGSLAAHDGHEELDALEEAECIQLLCKTANLSDVANGGADYIPALTLVRELGHHTLAILHAGSYMATAHCSIADYLDLFGTNRQRLLQRPRGQGLPRYDSVYATFGASMEFLERSGTGQVKRERKDALRLLEILSRFHYTSIPLELLLADTSAGVKRALKTPKRFKIWTNKLTAWHAAQVPYLVKAEEGDAKFRITEAVARLESLALVRTASDQAPWRLKSVSMHPLVHGWLGDCQSQEQQKRAMRMAECIVALSGYGTRGWRPYYPQLAPHLKRLVQLDAELVEDATRCRHVLQTCVQIGWTLHRMDLNSDLYGPLYGLMGKIEQRLHYQKPTHRLRELYQVFAVSVDSRGGRNPAQGIKVFEAIAHLDEETLSEDSFFRLGNLRDLGNAYRKNGQTEEAVTLLRKVVKALEEIEQDGEDLLFAQHHLGMALSDDGQFKEAIAVLEKVVTNRQRLHPGNNHERVASQQALAVAYLEDGQIEEATPRLEEVAWENAQTLGEEHPSTATVQAWLAQAYRQAGRLSDVIALLERVVDTRTLVCGEKHPELLTSQHNLGSAYLKAGRTRESINILERVVQVKNLILDDTDRNKLGSQYELGRAYLKAGRTQDSIDLLEQVAHVEDSTLDDTDREKLALQHKLGYAYLRTGRIQDSIALLERVVQIQNSTLDDTDKQKLSSQHILGRAYLDAGKTTKAVRILEQVVQVERLLHEKGHLGRVISQKLLHKAYAARDADCSESRPDSEPEVGSGKTRGVKARFSALFSTPSSARLKRGRDDQENSKRRPPECDHARLNTA